MNKQTIEEICDWGGFVFFLGTNTACLLSGVYKGNMKSHGIEADIPLEYFWGANIVGTGIASLNDRDNMRKNFPKGLLFGTILAPLEFGAGYIMGYVGGLIGDKIS